MLQCDDKLPCRRQVPKMTYSFRFRVPAATPQSAIPLDLPQIKMPAQFPPHPMGKIGPLSHRVHLLHYLLLLLTGIALSRATMSYYASGLLFSRTSPSPGVPSLCTRRPAIQSIRDPLHHTGTPIPVQAIGREPVRPKPWCNPSGPDISSSVAQSQIDRQPCPTEAAEHH